MMIRGAEACRHLPARAMPHRWLSNLRILKDDRRGLGAIEFAMTAPFLILLYIGGYQLMDATAAYRKVGITARTVADVLSQFSSVTKADVQNANSAARQVLSPYSVANASTRISEIYITAAMIPTVKWSVGSGKPAMTNADLIGVRPNVLVPTALRVPDTYLIYSEISYRYVPVAGSLMIGTMTFQDQLFINPRRSKDVPCSDC